MVLGNHDLHYLNCFFNNKSLTDEDTFQSQMFHKKSLKMAKFLLQQPFVFSKKILTKRKAIQVAMVHAGIPRNMSLKKAETFSKLCELKLINDPKKNLKKIFENKKNFHPIDSFSGLVNFFTRVRVVNKNGLPNFSFKGRKKNIPPNLVAWFKKENKILPNKTNIRNNFNTSNKVIESILEKNPKIKVGTSTLTDEVKAARGQRAKDFATKNKTDFWTKNQPIDVSTGDVYDLDKYLNLHKTTRLKVDKITLGI